MAHSPRTRRGGQAASAAISPTFVARARRRRCDRAHGPKERLLAAEGVADTTLKRLEGVRPVTASGSASAGQEVGEIAVLDPSAAPQGVRAPVVCENVGMSADIIADIVTFWLSDSRDRPDRAHARRGWWYEGGPAVDEEIRARFGDLVPRACARELMGWRDTPEGALALVLLLDQFTRNLYRGTVGAYAGDPCAFEVVRHAIDRKLDRGLHPVARIWLYHPYHHSEEVAEQDRGLEAPASAPPARRSGLARLRGTKHRGLDAPPRHRRPLRPVPAPKRGARSRQHGGGAGPSGRGRQALRSGAAGDRPGRLTSPGAPA